MITFSVSSIRHICEFPGSIMEKKNAHEMGIIQYLEL